MTVTMTKIALITAMSLLRRSDCNCSLLHLLVKSSTRRKQRNSLCRALHQASGRVLHRWEHILRGRRCCTTLVKD
jgi:hypothetical protein